MSEFVVITDPRPAVRVIALSRPEKKNALTRAMYDALSAALRAADADRNVRVVCLTGTGDAFTAGNDIADFRSNPPGSPNKKSSDARRRPNAPGSMTVEPASGTSP